MSIRKKYPVFVLKTVGKNGTVVTRHTKHKKAFLIRLYGLQKLDTIKTASFMIRYTPHIRNESLSYYPNEFGEMARIAKFLLPKMRLQQP